jgi:hypothetical protein
MRNISTISGRIIFGPEQFYCLYGNESLEERVGSGVGQGDVCNKFVFKAIWARIQSARENVIHIYIKCSV